jgi:hypothetical protein
MRLLLLLGFRTQLLNDIVGIFPSQRNVLGMATSSENFAFAVAEVD